RTAHRPACRAGGGLMGRPSKLTPALEERILRAIKAGNHARVAAEYAGVHRATFHRWLERGDPTGSDAVDQPYRDFRAKLEQARAVAEARDVTLISKAAERDWRAAAWRLARAAPSRWGTRPGEPASDPPEALGLALPEGSQLSLGRLSD